MEKELLIKLVEAGYTHNALAAHFSVSCSCIGYNLKKHGLHTKGKERKWTDTQLVEAVEEAFSMIGVMKLLGLVPAGGNYASIARHVKRLALDTTHFTGQAHLRGKQHNWSKAKPLAEVLVENSTYASTSCLKRRLVRDGLLKYKCSICGLSEWQGERLGLPMDHINGVNNDNRLENLRLLCPNCHSQTPTFAGRNIGKNL